MATSIWTLILVLALRVSLCCAALSLWPGGTRNPTAQQPEFDFDFTENESELASLLANHAALETYARRPDCFRRVAATIRSRCGELEMHEDERVKAAISMTLCELATATHHSLPLECVSFTVDSNSDVSYAQKQQIPMQGNCVDALSRSAQFWSSYSGYLREVPQLCFAFRRWNDIDTAKEIYKNSTVETMTLIRLILAREKADLDGKKRWDAQLVGLEDIAGRLHGASSALDALLSVAAPRLQRDLGMVVGAFRSELADAQTRARVENSRMVELVGDELQLITQRHAHSLIELAPSFQAHLVEHLGGTLSAFGAQTLQALDLANLAQERWLNLTLQVQDMEQKMQHLSRSAANATTSLSASVIDAQAAAARSAAAFARLSATTHEALERVNASAGELARLGPRTGMGSGLLDLIRLIEVVLPVDRSRATAHAAYLYNLPLFPVLSMCFSFLLYLLRASFSALMSIALLILSFRKYQHVIQPVPVYNRDRRDDDVAIDDHSSLRLGGPTQIFNSTTRDPEISSRLSIRKSRIPDRLCSTSRRYR